MEKRKYTLGRRAEQQDETRRRIVEATMALHEEVGPRHTTISAIAERAGVQRLTVYRHFPDEAAIIGACSSAWLERHPPPAPPAPPAPPDAGSRDAGLSDLEWLQKALLALYDYYRRTHRMWEVVYRDADAIEAIRSVLADVGTYQKAYGSALRRRIRPGDAGGRDLRAAVALALTFSTWSTLAAQGLADKAMARMMAVCLLALAGPQPR